MPSGVPIVEAIGSSLFALLICLLVLRFGLLMYAVCLFVGMRLIVPNDEYDETRADFSRWKGIYETWRRRKQTYPEQLGQRESTDALRLQPAY